jgi:thiol-disulfide isomerase/thioredoxin
VQQSLPTAITTGAAEDIKQASAQFEDLEGNTVTLADYKGKRVLLNFWATWCRPCIAEMPSLQRTREILEKENYVFLLASDQPVGTIRSFVERKGLEFNFLKYKGSLSDLRINALPTTFIYNEEGEEVDKIIGATEWDAPEMIRKLKEER